MLAICCTSEYNTNSACTPNDEVDIVNNYVYPLVWIPGCNADDGEYVGV